MSSTRILPVARATTRIGAARDPNVEVEHGTSAKLVAGPEWAKGKKGDTGPRGPAGGQTSTLVAYTSVGGHRAVMAIGASGVVHADSLDSDHFGRVIGVTTGAAVVDGDVEVRHAGPIDEPSWTWVPGQDIWLGTDGLLTQALPATPAFVQRVGFALTETRMWVDLSEPILN